MNDESDDDLSRQLDDAFREFAMACRQERNRLAIAELDAQDRRFETACDDRQEVERSVARLLARVSRP